MRDLNQYDVIFCDIDDTLIHGLWTDLMAITWRLFKSPTVAEFLMTFQAVFHIFKCNQKLRYMLMNCQKPIIFLTARKETFATHLLIKSILDKKDLEISIILITLSNCKTLIAFFNNLTSICIVS